MVGVFDPHPWTCARGHDKSTVSVSGTKKNARVSLEFDRLPRVTVGTAAHWTWVRHNAPCENGAEVVGPQSKTGQASEQLPSVIVGHDASITGEHEPSFPGWVDDEDERRRTERRQALQAD